MSAPEPPTTGVERYETDPELEFVAYLDAVSLPGYADALRESASAYLSVETFAPGDLVMWKARMRNQLLPDEGAPAVVVRYLDEPETPDVDSEAEALDIVLGVIDGSETFRVFSFSSGRLTRWVAAKT
jgi:hypothetical protein